MGTKISTTSKGNVFLSNAGTIVNVGRISNFSMVELEFDSD